MNKLAVIVLSFGLAACSDQRPEEGAAPKQTGAPAPVPASATTPSAPAAAPSAPSGSVAATGGSAEATPSAGAPAANPAAGTIGCATPATLTCDAGQRDGCTGGLTAVHVCVAEDAKAGPPCVQEIALVCPDGQVDACLRNPPLANHHVCVVVPKPPA